jgi:hypothetical protein
MGGIWRTLGVAAGLGALLSLLFLPGCEGAKPFKYQPSSEIPEGPGLFTGKKGKFVIIGGDGAEEMKDEEKSNGQPKPQPGATR